MHDYEHTQPVTFIRWFLGFLVFLHIAGTVAMLALGLGERSFGALGGGVCFGFMLAIFHSLTVRVYPDAISLWFGIGLIRKRFPIADIQAIAIVPNRWHIAGIKRLPGGWVYSAGGNDLVEIHLKSGRRYRIGTDQPRELLAAIESAAAKSS